MAAAPIHPVLDITNAYCGGTEISRSCSTFFFQENCFLYFSAVGIFSIVKVLTIFWNPAGSLISAPLIVFVQSNYMALWHV